MTEIAIAALQLPDGRCAFQRRDGNTSISPHMLGFFGGHMDKGELSLDGVDRELGEETNLGLGPDDFTYLVSGTTPDGSKTAHFFRAFIPRSDFEHYEGVGVEVYGYEEVLARPDLAPTARFILQIALDSQMLP